MDAWPVLGISIAVLLGLDLFLHRSARETSRTAAIAWSAVWVLAGLGFGVYVWATLGKSAFHQYIAAYAIEKSLSLDNLFVFLIVFKTLGIEQEQQHTVLAWGVLGALVFRGLFVFLGVAALERWDWVSWGLGAILVWAAVRTFREDPDEEKDSRIVRFLSKHLPIARKTAATKFFVKRSGRWLATPLLVAVIGLELTDIVFATDSVPAALSVSRDRFVVYSSNAFAVLGLRALYLVLAQTLAHLRYLHYGLAGVLAFAAFKLFVSDWVEIPPLLSIGVIVGVLGVAVVASLLAGDRTVSA
ncbi:MAG: TerC/Alx family metal homeostasis membrane protein [Myxococcales bacterium]|nr:TerC/Alx family metal homeostasis membrane protein [Myxococcales bacterium]MCB9575531.1 TerC/Alx family metal homeostasis membrane protein [Polyangiaceae bacterium]